MPHPFVDLGNPVIDALGAPGSIQVERRAAGQNDQVDGYWKPGGLTTLTLDAAVQPSTPKEVERLPENERTKEAITTYTREKLLTSDVASSGEADTILWDGRRWKVSVAEDWTTQAGYCRSVATRLGE